MARRCRSACAPRALPLASAWAAVGVAAAPAVSAGGVVSRPHKRCAHLARAHQSRSAMHLAVSHDSGCSYTMSPGFRLCISLHNRRPVTVGETTWRALARPCSQ